MKKNITNPDHYNSGKISPIHFAMDQGFDVMQANAIKYLVRFKKKNGKEDLLKSQEYLRMMIDEYDMWYK